MASIWAYMCSILRVNSNHSLCLSISKFTDLICSVNQDPSRQKVASIWAYICSRLRVHSNHSLIPPVPKFTDLICSVHQDPIRQKVVSIWAYMCSKLRIHSNHSLCLSISKFTDLICSVVYIMKWPYTFSTQKTKPSKSGFHLSLLCAVYLEYIVTIHFVRPCPNQLTLYVQYNKTLAVKKWLPFELICAV